MTHSSFHSHNYHTTPQRATFSWSSCIVLLTHCWIQFANTLLRIFLLCLCSWGMLVYSLAPFLAFPSPLIIPGPIDSCLLHFIPSIRPSLSLILYLNWFSVSSVSWTLFHLHEIKKKKIQCFSLFTVLVRVQAGHSQHIQRVIEKPLMERLFTMVSAVRETYKGWWPTEGLAGTGYSWYCYHLRHSGGREGYRNPAKSVAMGEGSSVVDTDLGQGSQLLPEPHAGRERGREWIL